MDRLIIRAVTEAANFVAEQIKREIEDQGHKATGELINSVEVDISVQGDKIVGVVRLNDYAKYLNEKQQPHYPPFSVIYDWAKVVRRDLNDKEQRSFAWAVVNKIGKEGMPTSGALRFSNNGRRTEWAKYAIADNLNEIRNKLRLNEVFRETIIEQFAA